MQPCHVRNQLMMKLFIWGEVTFDPSVALCDGFVDPHHDTHGRGMSQKTDDHTAIPLCRKHHDHLHRGTGVFKKMTKQQRHEWHRDAAAQYKPWDDAF